MRRTWRQTAWFLGVTVAAFLFGCGLFGSGYTFGYLEGLKSCSALVQEQEAELTVLRGWYANQEWQQRQPPPAQ